MKGVTVKLNVKKLARAAGIENASQLMRALECSNETAYALWNETVAMIRLDTMAKCFQVFNCGPSELFTVTNGHKRK